MHRFIDERTKITDTMGLHNEIYQKRSKYWVTYKTIKTMNISQENPKRFYNPWESTWVLLSSFKLIMVS
jgi:hypothetical protein